MLKNLYINNYKLILGVYKMLEIRKSHKILKDVPYMTLKQATFVDNLIKEYNLRNLLELGWMYGTSSCYMASTLKEVGGGHLTTIDLHTAKTRTPNLEELLKKLDLEEYVTYYYEDTSYTWRLMKFLEENDKPIFDFCYIDGAHDWFVDGFAFLLVDKLLKPGGWVIFDDLYWTFEKSKGLRNNPRVKKMPIEEKTTPQINKVFELLVKRHPDYHNFDIVHDWWGIAQKKPDTKTYPELVNENALLKDHNTKLLNENILWKDHNAKLLKENNSLNEQILKYHTVLKY